MKSQLADVTIRDIIAVLVSAGVFLLIVCKITVPDQVWSAWLVILTFFYTSKTNGSSQTTDTTATNKGA